AVPIENAKRQFDVNLFAVDQITQLVLPFMRHQGSGRIVNISSIAGDIYSSLGGWYHATKAGLNMWSDVLDSEVHRFGIRSVVVQPGLTKSEWSTIALNNARKNLLDNSPYSDLVDKLENMFGKINTGATSEELAKVFYQAATDVRPKRRYYHSIVDHGMVVIARSMPNTYRAVLNRLMK
ncbi:SDR family NAD(P)-dependent oxidoreductase, partial [Lactobacillus halodurans]